MSLKDRPSRLCTADESALIIKQASRGERTGALGRIISQNPVDKDDLFTLAEPPFSTEASSSLSGTSRQVKRRKDANEQGENAFKQEQPTPSGEAMAATKLQDSRGQQRSDDVGGGERDPEEAQADGEFGGGVVVAEVEDGLREEFE